MEKVFVNPYAKLDLLVDASSIGENVPLVRKGRYLKNVKKLVEPFVMEGLSVERESCTHQTDSAWIRYHGKVEGKREEVKVWTEIRRDSDLYTGDGNFVAVSTDIRIFNLTDEEMLKNYEGDESKISDYVNNHIVRTIKEEAGLGIEGVFNFSTLELCVPIPLHRRVLLVLDQVDTIAEIYKHVMTDPAVVSAVNELVDNDESLGKLEQVRSMADGKNEAYEAFYTYIENSRKDHRSAIVKRSNVLLEAIKKQVQRRIPKELKELKAELEKQEPEINILPLKEPSRGSGTMAGGGGGIASGG